MYTFTTDTELTRLSGQFQGLIDAARRAYRFAGESMNETLDTFQFSPHPNPSSGCALVLNKQEKCITFITHKAKAIINGAYFIETGENFDDFVAQVRTMSEAKRAVFIAQHENAASKAVSTWLGYPVKVSLVRDYSFADIRRITLQTDDIDDAAVTAISKLLRYAELIPQGETADYDLSPA